jgi:hypothetical protein
MNGPEVHGALAARNVTHLHHANTVTTSCTFLSNRGLVSRGWVEYHRLPQTPQMSDALDKHFGIWNDVFMDGVDIHSRGRWRNLYGPVLFEFPLDILLRLPPGTEVYVTKKNPSNWRSGETWNDWVYASAQELEAEYSFGDFGKHIVFRNAQWSLPFLTNPVEITLDDPQARLANGQDAFTLASQKLQAAAAQGGVPIVIRKRQCSGDCRCMTTGQRSYTGQSLDPLF